MLSSRDASSSAVKRREAVSAAATGIPIHPPQLPNPLPARVDTAGCLCPEWVGIVNVHKDLVRPPQFRQTRETALLARDWQVANLEGTAATPLHSDQLVIRQESP